MAADACGRGEGGAGRTLPGLADRPGDGGTLRRAGSGVLHADLTACGTYADGLEAGNRVWCPTVLVVGELDRMTPACCGHKLAQAIPGAQAVDLPGVGHMLPMEVPDAVLDALRTIM